MQVRTNRAPRTAPSRSIPPSRPARGPGRPPARRGVPVRRIPGYTRPLPPLPPPASAPLTRVASRAAATAGRRIPLVLIATTLGSMLPNREQSSDGALRLDLTGWELIGKCDDFYNCYTLGGGYCANQAFHTNQQIAEADGYPAPLTSGNRFQNADQIFLGRWWDHIDPVSNAEGKQHWLTQGWQRTTSAPEGAPAVVSSPGVNAWAPVPGIRNPNFVRATPSPETPPGSPAPNEAFAPPQTASPPANPPSNWQFSTSKGANPHRRQPPRPNQRENKQISRSVQIGVALFRLLDNISELSEIVDAFYDALPDDVKARWEKDRPSRGLIDNAGQYGIDGADWKLQALFHNWHRLDGGQALRNTARNLMQDIAVGTLHRYLPRNIGRAVQSGQMSYAQAIEWLLDKWGL